LKKLSTFQAGPSNNNSTTQSGYSCFSLLSQPLLLLEHPDFSSDQRFESRILRKFKKSSNQHIFLQDEQDFTGFTPFLS